MDIHEVRQMLRTKSIYDIPLRVTYYARVSSETDEQLNSLDNQVSYYEEFIKRNAKWSFVAGYVDATVIIGLKQNPTHGRRFSPIFFA